jgi:NAD(P)-dependent dehydrogenase (short-subunit alcohol dehydrogenase family)
METTSIPSPHELFNLEGKTAVVTGASSGLGERFCLLLATAGAQVIAAARRADRLMALASRDSRIVPVVADVTTREGRESIGSTLSERAPRADIVVNNAGISSPLHAEHEDEAAFENVLSVNLTASYALIRDLVVRAENRNGITVVNVASILGLVAGAPIGGAGYTASKAGLIGLTRELAGQLGRSGVRVNALAPGWFRSEMTTDLFDEPSSAPWIERNTMVARAGREGELDTALLFLCASASSYVTGQVLAVDGGWTAR